LLEKTLVSGEIKNGYISIPANCGIFDEAEYGVKNKGREFELLLPDGSSLITDIRNRSGNSSTSGRLRSRFYSIFKNDSRYQVGACLTIRKLSDGKYCMKFKAAQNNPSPAPIAETAINVELTKNSIMLNTILYGPPGTGKTYATTELAVKIAEPEFYQEVALNTDEHERRKVIKARYDDLVASNRVGFATFHQSFCYEDFIEGIRAKTSDDGGGLVYEVEDGIFKKLATLAASHNSEIVVGHSSSLNTESRNYVLILDEINRGNIARIFGELITLLEPDKRENGEDERSVILPYSKELFTVPENLYVIGTMNTADKSLAQLDLALRRRFDFVEVMPKPGLLNGVEAYGVSVENLLEVINARIEVLLDRDHLIGHSYFLSLKQVGVDKDHLISLIFENRIIPLLQEYFFSDWEKIGWVLNDIDKPWDDRFIQLQQDNVALNSLFSAKVADEVQDRRYKINTSAFTNPAAYRGILLGNVSE
tara:strand:+ start:461 stop:1900 length:1440 start_codon:yes stop_codon:yes gene_type:complete